jgi:hypothetical protein
LNAIAWSVRPSIEGVTETVPLERPMSAPLLALGAVPSRV